MIKVTKLSNNNISKNMKYSIEINDHIIGFTKNALLELQYKIDNVLKEE